MSNGTKNSLSVRQTFVREIERQILSEELKPGDRLPTSRELCAQMGVSLTIVNAGVAELANKGFVEVKPRHGVYVTDYRTSGNPAILSSILQYNGMGSASGEASPGRGPKSVLCADHGVSLYALSNE